MNVLTFKVDVPDTGSGPQTFYFATAAMVSTDTSTPAGEPFRALVSDPGGVSLRVFGNGRAAGLVTPTWGETEFNNVSGAFAGWVNFNTSGGKVTCHYGPPDAEYPAGFGDPIFIAYIDGRPEVNDKRMRLRYRGRELKFEQPVVTETFAGNDTPREGTGVAGVRRKRLVFGTPGYVDCILLDEVQNTWFVHANEMAARSLLFDGGVELDDGGTYTSPDDIGSEGDPVPGEFKLATDAYGNVYAVLGSPVRVELRAYPDGSIESASITERRWHIVDLANRAGITDADAGAMPSGSEAFDAGNRVVEMQTYRQVLEDVAAFEVAAIGFNQLDEFFAQSIEPASVGTSVFDFTEGQNSRAWDLAAPPGMGRRVWKVDLKAGAARACALAGAVADGSLEGLDLAVRDALVRDPWMTQFTAFSQGVLDADASAERDEVEIVGNQFPDQTAMLDWAERYLSIRGALQTFVSLEADLTSATAALRLLQKVTAISSRYGTRAMRIIGIDQQLKRRKIVFTLVGHSDVPADVAIERVDDTVGAGGNGAGSGSAGTGTTETTTVHESFVIACSDETTALTAGTAKRTMFMPYAFTLTEVQAALVTPQTSGTIFTVDINDAGTSVLSTKITIDNTENTSITAAAAAVISDTAIAKGAKITVDIDQVGDGTAKGLIVTLIGVRA